jgi:6-phosphogluconolactonase (cycloisomerase 2 family)
LAAVNGSPFSAGLGPLAMVTTIDGKFLFVANAQSNQISQFKVSLGTGVLVANTQPEISTGGNPVSLVIRAGSKTISSTEGTEDFLFVANRGGATLFSYQFDSTLGLLSVITPVDTTGQPSAVVAK